MRPEKEGVGEGPRLEESGQEPVPVKRQDWRQQVPRQAAWGRVLRYRGIIPGM